MKHLVIIISSLFTVVCYGQHELSSVNKWRHVSVPIHKDSIEKYSFDLLGEWKVFIKNNDVVATKNRYLVLDTLPFKIIPSEEDRYKIGGRQSFVKVEDGYLLGFNRGEWGGNLFWFSEDGKTKYEISNHQIVKFINRDNKIYAIEGLSHLGSSRGSIVEVEQIDKKWVAKQVLKLQSAPYGVDLDNKNNLIIITSNSLLKVDMNFKSEILTNDHFWYPGFYPTSLIVKDNIAYSGMRKGIFKYNLNTHKQEWLMNDE